MTHVHAARTKGATAEEIAEALGVSVDSLRVGLRAEAGAGYGDRTLLTRDSKLVMVRDFWR